jgi:hypothetical protein
VSRRPTAAAAGDASSVVPPGSQVSSSSPAVHGPLTRTASETPTTPGWAGRGPPTSPLASIQPATSTSISSLLHCSQTPRRHSNEDLSVSSPDPLQLFSPVAKRYLARSASDAHNSFPTHDVAKLGTTSSPILLVQRLDAGMGESLSPNLSHTRAFSPQTVSARHHSLPPDPFMVPALTVAETNQDESSIVGNTANAVGGRYSMRTRQPRQLKPYAFDRLEYKHQLKHHPDAIVKFTGHPNPAGFSSSPPSGSSEGDSDGAAENLGGEPVQRPPRAKGKKRHRPNTEHPPSVPPTVHRRTSGPGPTVRSPSLDRRPAGSPRVEGRNWVASAPGSDRTGSPQVLTPWYPDVFDDLSSGLDSDEMPLSTVLDPPRVGDTPPPRVRRKRVIFWPQYASVWANE